MSFFTSEKIDQEANNGEGHAHVYVYVDGQKVSRIYGSWFHLTDLTSDLHAIRVPLNANIHSEFALNGRPFEAITEIVEE